ncbi:MAG: hypothetical protein ACFFBH_16900 [Promethearchaeota archaeon]
MVLFDYFDGFLAGIDFLIALGSLIGLLGLIIGFILFVWGGKRIRYRILGVIIFSLVLLAICGVETGIRYFSIYR